jgi:hypothetical protein
VQQSEKMQAVSSAVGTAAIAVEAMPGFIIRHTLGSLIVFLIMLTIIYFAVSALTPAPRSGVPLL